MKVGVIGNGMMARSLGTRWTALGHHVAIGGRSATRARALAGELGPLASGGTVAEAVADAALILLAVRYADVPGAVAAIAASDVGGGGRHPVLADCTNPVEVEGFTLVTDGRSMAEEVAEALPMVSVVKAFNMSHASVFELEHPLVGGAALQVPLCGDDPEAKDVVAALVESMGCAPLDIGGLHQARLLEAAAAIVIRQIFIGGDPTVSLALRPARAA